MTEKKQTLAINNIQCVLKLIESTLSHHRKSPICHQASDIAELWLEVLSICKLIAYIGCAVEPRKYC